MEKDALLELWGVRGSAPAAGSDRVRFGSHTMCSRVVTPEKQEAVVIDAGSGIIPLGRRILEEWGEDGGRIHLLLTHFHLDHVLGFPLFDPLYRKEVEIVVHSPIPPGEAERCLAGLMTGRLFPLELEEVPASVEFRQLPEEGLALGGGRITAHPLHHPQGSVAYRVDRDGRAWVTATDNEFPERGEDRALADFCRNVDVLICDATFLPEEYPEKVGWGHSTWESGVRLAEEAGAARLILAHFNPGHDDTVVEEMVKAARSRYPGARAAVEETAGGDDPGAGRKGGRP